MKTKSNKETKVNVITLGCSKNLVDSEVLMGQLKASQFDVAHESTKDDADIVIATKTNYKQKFQK